MHKANSTRTRMKKPMSKSTLLLLPAAVKIGASSANYNGWVDATPTDMTNMKFRGNHCCHQKSDEGRCH